MQTETAIILWILVFLLILGIIAYSLDNLIERVDRLEKYLNSETDNIRYELRLRLRDVPFPKPYDSDWPCKPGDGHLCIQRGAVEEWGEDPEYFYCAECGGKAHSNIDGSELPTRDKVDR